MMVRGHRYWDTALFQWDTKLSRSSSILRYWAFSQDTEPRPKKTVIGYWDTELRRRTKILRYWDTELRQAEKDTEILRYWASPDGERLRYWDTVLRQTEKDTEILCFADGQRYWDTVLCVQDTEILSLADRERYWDTELRRQRKILRYWGMPVSVRKMITNKIVTIYLETEQELEAHIQQSCSAIKIN